MGPAGISESYTVRPNDSRILAQRLTSAFLMLLQCCSLLMEHVSNFRSHTLVSQRIPFLTTPRSENHATDGVLFNRYWHANVSACVVHASGTAWQGQPYPSPVHSYSFHIVRLYSFKVFSFDSCLLSFWYCHTNSILCHHKAVVSDTPGRCDRS